MDDFTIERPEDMHFEGIDYGQFPCGVLILSPEEHGLVGLLGCVPVPELVDDLDDEELEEIAEFLVQSNQDLAGKTYGTDFKLVFVKTAAWKQIVHAGKLQ